MAVKDGLGPAGRLIIMILSYHPNYHDSYHDNHYESYHPNYHDSYHDNHYDIKHKHNKCGQVAPAGGAPEHKGAVQARTKPDI